MGRIFDETEHAIKKGLCPCCGQKLVFQEGCMHCVACGWGRCDG